MTTQIEKSNGIEKNFPKAALMASFKRDFRSLNDEEKARYVQAVCVALKIPTPLNPFYFIKTKSGGEVLYASSEAAQLIAKQNNITCQITKREIDTKTGLCTVEMRASFIDGRYTDNIGCLHVGTLTGNDLANALMKCVTKAMRRSVLSAVGLSIGDDDLPEREQPARATDVAQPAQTFQNVIEAQKEIPKHIEEEKEIQEARTELFKVLLGKSSMFFNDPAGAARWVKENSGKEFHDINAMEALDLINLVQRVDIPEDHIIEPTIEKQVEEIKEEKKPYWLSKTKDGKEFINARAGNHFTREQLEFIGLKPSKKEGCFWAFYDKKIIESLEKITTVTASEDSEAMGV